MAIKSTYNEPKTYRELKLIQENEYLIMVEKMKIYAKQFLEDARNQPQGHEAGFYNDRTKMLRESIAVYILRNGTIIWADEQGNKATNRYLIMQVPIILKGFAIIAIAGKYYASYVENKGYNVITTQGDKLIFDMIKVFNLRNYGRV